MASCQGSDLGGSHVIIRRYNRLPQTHLTAKCKNAHVGNGEMKKSAPQTSFTVFSETACTNPLFKGEEQRPAENYYHIDCLL